MGRAKIAIGIALILAAFSWLALSGFNAGKSYYKTVDEVNAMGLSALGKPLRIAGIVAKGSIRDEGDGLWFTLEHNGSVIDVHYVSTNPLPDTFKEGVDAMAEGKLASPGTLRAEKLQAKCASKYQAEAK